MTEKYIILRSLTFIYSANESKEPTLTDIVFEIKVLITFENRAEKLLAWL